MIDLNLNIKLEKNKLYSSAGNIFSRLLLMKNLLSESKSFLIIVENERRVLTYQKIAKSLNIRLDILDNIGDLVNLIFNNSGTFVVTKDIFNIDIKDKKTFKDYKFTIKKGDKISPQDLAKKLNSLGLSFGEFQNPNSFSISGDILNFIDKSGQIIKVSFWGDEIDEIWLFNQKLDNYSFGVNEPLKNFMGRLCEENLNTNKNKIKSIEMGRLCEDLLELYSSKEIFTILDSIDFYSEYDLIFPYLKHFLVFLSVSSNTKNEDLGFKDLVINNIEDFVRFLKNKVSHKFIVTRNRKVVANFLNLNNLDDVVVVDTDLNNLKSFEYNTPILNSFPLGRGKDGAINPSPSTRMSSSYVILGQPERLNRESTRGSGEKGLGDRGIQNGFVICDDNISRIFVKKRIKKSLSENFDLLLQMKKGDYVVHIDHGIGIFSEIVEKEISGIRKEYLMIEYKDDDKLFVPITEVSRLSKYVGVENPKLTSLSTKDWEKKLKKADEDTTQIASELLEIYAKRKLQKGFQFQKREELENEFFNSFEFIYTDDQFAVIKDIFQDMESPFPMDRLLSGDVGFGKTEVAFAAIFKSIVNGKQAALISPLVVLAYEHYEKAILRFADFPFNIEVLTRFEKPTIVKNTLKKLKEGKIDLIIGTHRLLSEDVKFKDLGLLVIDEEHKFGVKDKEKIKTFKGNVDILSMSATPIPRSLNMALNGLKEVSLLTTPPVGKQSIETIISQFDDKVIFDASKKELERGGQIFFIHNRVETITGMQDYLEKLLPGKKIVVAHGQLLGDELEKRIIAFKKREYDILLATTVIENGIDFSNVNTIFINDANNFGISQIHQLRGRVGRVGTKAYAYLLFKKDKIKEDAAKRLKTIVDYSHLGAGFELAVKDLEIRGGGDILGIRQSGSSVEIGVSLFLEMLENKIEELKNSFRHSDENQNHKNVMTFDDPESSSGGRKGNLIRINTTIDLNIEAYLPNDFFTSELDKLNFYREIESIGNLEDLENLMVSFDELNKEFQKSSFNLFSLIKLKILASNYKIKSIKRVGINYQVDFEENTSLEELKKFLLLDKEVKFSVISVTRLRTSIKNFTSDEKFIQYLLFIFEGKIERKKLRLKS